MIRHMVWKFRDTMWRSFTSISATLNRLGFRTNTSDVAAFYCFILIGSVLLAWAFAT